MLAPPGAGASSGVPPGTPSSVSVERADGTLTASWPAVEGATSYHVTYSSDGMSSWSLAAFDHLSASITFSVDNSDSYVVGVRARNAHGGSGWRNSAEAGPWTPPLPDRPASVSVTRSDGTLTATWPAAAGADSYHVTYTSDGAETWSLAAFDHPSSSITISASNGASYMVGVRARNAGGWSGWRNSPLASAYTPPAGPQNPIVEPGDGYLDFSWDAVSGAVSYDVRAKAQGAASWHGVASGVTATSYRYTTDVTLDYLSVRARSSGGAGPWADISRMPSAELQASYSSDTVAASSPAGAQASAGLVSAAAQAESNTQLGQVTWGTITRETRSALANSTFRVNWTGVSGADGYNFVCSYWGGWHWDLCGWGTGTFGVAANYGTVPAGQAQPLIISHFWRKDGPGRPGKYSLPNRLMMLAVRAVKFDDPSAAGPWAQTEEIHPFFPNLREFSYSRGNGSITMAWTPNFWITGYEIDCAVSVPAGQTPAYTRCATLTAQDDTAAQHTATVSNWTAGGTSYSIDNTKTYDIKITSTNKWSSGGWLAPLMSPITLTESNVTSTSASLTLAEYTGNWWLKQTTPADANCTSMGAANATGSTADLTGLTPGISYTYKAYSDSACADEIVTVTFATA